MSWKFDEQTERVLLKKVFSGPTYAKELFISEYFLSNGEPLELLEAHSYSYFITYTFKDLKGNIFKHRINEAYGPDTLADCGVLNRITIFREEDGVIIELSSNMERIGNRTIQLVKKQYIEHKNDKRPSILDRTCKKIKNTFIRTEN